MTMIDEIQGWQNLPPDQAAREVSRFLEELGELAAFLLEALQGDPSERLMAFLEVERELQGRVGCESLDLDLTA